LFPYWILFSVFAAGTLQHRRRAGDMRERNWVLVFAGLLTALMIGLRYHVGGDWGSYESMFEDVRYFDLADALRYGDPGYSGLNWLAHALGFEIWFVNLVCAAIFTWGLMRFARAQPNPWLAVLVAVPYLVIVVAMGYTRQAVAIGFVLAGLAGLEHRSIFRFSLYVFCAVAFHKSAIVVLPVVALSASQNRLVTVGLLLGLMATLYYVFVSSSMGDLVTNYVDAQYQSQGAMIRAAMSIPPALLFLLLRNRFELSEEQRRLWQNFSFAALATIALLMVSSASTAVDRLALYLIPLQMFVLSRLPDIFGRDGARNGQLLLVVIVYSALIQFTWLTKADNANYWLPYRLYPLFSQPADEDLAGAAITAPPGSA
jgi:hypothetical protein